MKVQCWAQSTVTHSHLLEVGLSGCSPRGCASPHTQWLHLHNVSEACRVSRCFPILQMRKLRPVQGCWE